MAKKVEDLLVCHKAMKAFVAISALVERSPIRKNFKLRDQLMDAACSVHRNISEGGGQQTDKLLIRYLYYSYGSTKEVRSELVEAVKLRYISEADRVAHDELYDEIARMLNGWIKYLKRSNRKSRLTGQPQPDGDENTSTDD